MRRLLKLIDAVSLVLVRGAVGTQSASAGISPRVIKVTHRNGVKSIGGVNVAHRSLDFTVVKHKFGKPAHARVKSASQCNLFYPSGLWLLMTSFGVAADCGYLLLQTAIISRKSWVMKVGKTKYRIGMPKSKLPRDATFIPHYGYQLASAHLFRSRSGSAFASLGGGTRIKYLTVFVGGAGD